MAAHKDDDNGLDSMPPAEAGCVGEYDSAFEYDSEHEKKVAKRRDLAVKGQPKNHTGRVKKQVFTEEYNKNAGISQNYHRTGVDAYARHKQLINDYFLYYKGSTAILRRDTSGDRTDLDIIRENHKFIWSDDDDAESSWGQQMAKKYYDKLFKEYCIADLSRYRENRVAMRWRIEREVVDGKGQFVCGNKACDEKDGLRSWEVNFAYAEDGTKKNALIKLRLCVPCSEKLNYKHKRKEAKKKKRNSVATDDVATCTKKSKTSKDTSNIGQASEDDVKSVTTEDKQEIEEIWKAPVRLDDKSREEEFGEYFDDLFL